MVLALWLLLGTAGAWVGTPGSDAADDLVPASPQDQATAVRLLCAGSSESACPLGQRIAAAEWLLAHPAPEAAAPLLRVFARSRFGDLPEDPDLFERARRGVEALPLVDQRRAVAEGLAPGLVELSWNRLLRRWLGPLGAQSDPGLLRVLQGWPRAQADAWRGLSETLSEELLAAFDADPTGFVPALATEGGSLAEAAAQRADDALLASLLQSPDPGVVDLALQVVHGGGGGGPRTQDALQALADAEPPLAKRAQTALALPALSRSLPPLRVPQTPPAARAESPVRRPEAPLSTFVEVRTGRERHPTRLLALLALGLCGGAALVGARSRSRRTRAAAACVLGLSVPLGLEVVLRLAGVPSLVEEGPLFAFYREDKALLSPHPKEDAVVSPGGPVRHQAIAWPEPPGNLRVATVGASTAHGSHYLQEEAFSSWATAALASQWPGPVDSLNLSIGGARSDAARRAGALALEHGADALVVCIGHNEAGGFATLGHWDPQSARVLGARLWLSHSALYGAAARRVPALRAHPTPEPATPTRADTARLLALAEANLSWNLGPLFSSAQAAGVPVVLVVPPTNWRFALLEPWSTPGAGDAQDLEQRMQAAEAEAARGDGAAARATVQGAIDVGSSPRELTAA